LEALTYLFLSELLSEAQKLPLDKIELMFYI
jgi:hypothetical protein